MNKLLNKHNAVRKWAAAAVIIVEDIIILSLFSSIYMCHSADLGPALSAFISIVVYIMLMILFPIFNHDCLYRYIGHKYLFIVEICAAISIISLLCCMSLSHE